MGRREKEENMGKTTQLDDMVSSSEIAKLIGKTSRTVQQLTSDGILPTVEIKNKTRVTRKYDKYKTMHAYIRYIEEKAAGKNGSDKENEKLQVEIEIKKTKLKMEQIKLDELEGKMHSAEDVEEMTTDLVMCVRSNLLAMPGHVAVELAQINDASEISVKMQEAVNSILKELAGYKYDPEEYRKRVKERQGWLNDEQGEKED